MNFKIYRVTSFAVFVPSLRFEIFQTVMVDISYVTNMHIRVIRISFISLLLSNKIG